jgi:hypothetical protein
VDGWSLIQIDKQADEIKVRSNGGIVLTGENRMIRRKSVSVPSVRHKSQRAKLGVKGWQRIVQATEQSQAIGNSLVQELITIKTNTANNNNFLMSFCGNTTGLWNSLQAQYVLRTEQSEHCRAE